MQKNGQGLKQLTKGQFSSIYNPQWSPDGKQISFAALENNVEGLYLINPDGSGLTRLSVPGWNIANWSPDGRKLAYITGDLQKLAESRIEIIDLAGNNLRTIHFDTLKGEPDPAYFAIHWSDDGKFIQFLLSKFNGGIPYDVNDHWTIYQAGVQDGNLQNLLESKIPIVGWYGTAADLTYVTADESKNIWQWIHNETILATWNQVISDPYFHCQWSPNHRQLVCAMRDSYTGESFQLLLMNADDFSIKSIAQNLSINGIMITPSWSPDGRYLVFHSSLESPGNDDIYSLDVQAALNNPSIKPVRLTTSGFNDVLPAWQP